VLAWARATGLPPSKLGTYPLLLEAVMAAFELLIVVEEPEVDSLELQSALTSGQQ